jgi:hypothetical protein
LYCQLVSFLLRPRLIPPILYPLYLLTNKTKFYLRSFPLYASSVFCHTSILHHSDTCINTPTHASLTQTTNKSPINQNRFRANSSGKTQKLLVERMTRVARMKQATTKNSTSV